MAFTGNFLCTSFKEQLLKGEHDLDTDTLKMALYNNSASFTAATTAYTTSNEITGTGYTAGGEACTNVSVSTSGTTAYIDFDDVQWSSATFTARGALLYNDSHASNAAIAIFDFGSDQSVSSGFFTITLPTASASDAIIRIA